VTSAQACAGQCRAAVGTLPAARNLARGRLIGNGASLVGWVVLAALPLPPTDDGAACEEWAVEAAQELLLAPQPPVTGLNGQTRGGLADVPLSTWSALSSFELEKDEADGAQRRRVREGTARVSSVPGFAAGLSRLQEPLHQVLLASLGPANRLPETAQVWRTLDPPSGMEWFRVANAVGQLGSALGWRALERGDLEEARLACLGLYGFLRAQAGTDLLGQLLSAGQTPWLARLCTALARAEPTNSRRALLEELLLAEKEWPPFSHTLRQELVFGQLITAASWPLDLRARVPAAWDGVVAGRAHEAEPSTWSRFRQRLFGRLAGRERCLWMAALIRVADKPPMISDPILAEAGNASFLSRLADEGPAAGSTWLSFARRLRRSRTHLRMTTFAVRALLDQQPTEASLDARAGRPLELRGSGADRMVVAPADPAFDAEELRLPVPEGRPTLP
jgi:hypothetical protein